MGRMEGLLEDARKMVLEGFPLRFKEVPKDLEDVIRTID